MVISFAAPFWDSRASDYSVSLKFSTYSRVPGKFAWVVSVLGANLRWPIGVAAQTKTLSAQKKRSFE